MRVVFVGGGTGGHFYPLIAIAEWLIKSSPERNENIPEMYYMGPEPYSQKVLRKHDITFISCPAGKYRRYASILNFFDFFKSMWGIVVAIIKLFKIYPDVVMSKGGYTSVPVTLAAWFLRIPVVIHESDAKPGKANKIAAKFARYIAVSYSDTADFFPSQKTALTGIPMRLALLQEVTSDLHNIFGTNPNLHTILILGGSQGAERVNKLVLESLDELLPNYNIIHQTGEKSYENTKASAEVLIKDKALIANYHALAFLDAELYNKALNHASIIVSRAGSGTIHDISIHGKPSILIPIPENISHDQRTNAYAYARTGAATVMEEGNLRDGLLEEEIRRIMSDQQMYNAIIEAALSFAPRDAARVLGTAIIEIGKEH